MPPTTWGRRKRRVLRPPRGDAWQGSVTAWKPLRPPRGVPRRCETHIALASRAGGSRTPPCPPRPRTSTVPAARRTARASTPRSAGTAGGGRWPRRSAGLAASAAGRRSGLRTQRAASERGGGAAQDSPRPASGERVPPTAEGSPQALDARRVGGGLRASLPTVPLHPRIRSSRRRAVSPVPQVTGRTPPSPRRHAGADGAVSSARLNAISPSCLRRKLGTSLLHSVPHSAYLQG